MRYLSYCFAFFLGLACSVSASEPQQADALAAPMLTAIGEPVRPVTIVDGPGKRVAYDATTGFVTTREMMASLATPDAQATAFAWALAAWDLNYAGKRASGIKKVRAAQNGNGDWLWLMAAAAGEAADGREMRAPENGYRSDDLTRLERDPDWTGQRVAGRQQVLARLRADLAARAQALLERARPGSRLATLDGRVSPGGAFELVERP